MPSRFTVLHRRRGDVEVKSANHRPGERCIVASAAIPEVIHPDVLSPCRTCAFRVPETVLWEVLPYASRDPEAVGSRPSRLGRPTETPHGTRHGSLPAIM